MDIGGRNIFNSDHDMFRSQVRRWMRERLAPLQASFEENGQPTKEIWAEMGNQGMLGVSIPAEVGGIGASFLEEAIVAEKTKPDAKRAAHCISLFLVDAD